MINDYIFDFAYGEALNDLYWRKEAGIKECVEKTEEIKKAVRAYADAVIMGEMPCLYNTAHVIENICIKETDKKLEFGNIQKLINITMKHLYIKYYDTNRKAFRCCHAPMDDIMRDFVGRAYKKAFKKYLGISGVSWSSVSEEEYKKYQDAIVALINKSESDCLPIEFDYMNWGKNNPDDIKYEFFKEKD